MRRQLIPALCLILNIDSLLYFDVIESTWNHCLYMSLEVCDDVLSTTKTLNFDQGIEKKKKTGDVILVECE